MKSKVKFAINSSYRIKHADIVGIFQVIRVSGGRYHMFSNDLDKDLKLTKAELTKAIEDAGGSVGDISQAVVRIPTTTPQQFIDYKKEWCDQNLDHYNKDYRPKMKAMIENVEIGAMYYYGSGSYRMRDVYRVDNIIKRPSKHKPKKGEAQEFEYICIIKVWNWREKTWGGKPNTYEEYAYQVELGEFVREARFPKLTKPPLELYKEADTALASGDISKYQLDVDERREAQGPDTQIMHLGSKTALEAIHSDLEARRDHAEIVMETMHMIIEQKKRDLEQATRSITQRLAGQIELFKKKIKKIFRVITTLELYLGIDEEIVQILEGPPAPVDDPICIRQAIMFMDEEFGDPWDDGQGMEWKDLSAFGDWLVRNGNYKKVMPESKSIAAFKVRRNEKERSGNPYWVARMAEQDNWTFLVMRNGDNIYRLVTDKIEFRPRLFPKRKELQQLFELWKVADAAEEKEREADRKEREKNRAKFRSQEDIDEDEAEEKGSDYSDTRVSFGSYDEEREAIKKKFGETDFSGSYNKSGDIKEYAEDHVFFYKMRFTLFQGVIERTQIFHPMSEPIKLFDDDFIDRGLVRLIYDDELTLPSGRKSFWEWMRDMNSKIDYGSRIILSHNWGFISSFVRDGGDSAKDAYYARKERGNRLDDRYGNGEGFSNLPDDPNPGMYYVKKGNRWEWVEVMIDNPYWNPNLFTTPDETGYAPDYQTEKKPKDPSKWLGMNNKKDYGKHVHSHTWMSYEDQVKWFGKVVRDERGFPFEQKEGSHVYNVFKNPKRIQKYEWEDVWEWKNGDRVVTGKRPSFIRERVKVDFMCIRYNPKDKIEREGWTWKWDAEERKMNLSWKITHDDGFIINYDEIKIEDIDFYLNSRVDRRHYTNMMPLLWEVRKHLMVERESEADFKKLVQGEVLKASGVIPSDEQIDQACEDWKKNLKWKRAISHDDSKALRMITKRLTK